MQQQTKTDEKIKKKISREIQTSPISPITQNSEHFIYPKKFIDKKTEIEKKSSILNINDFEDYHILKKKLRRVIIFRFLLPLYAYL